MGQWLPGGPGGHSDGARGLLLRPPPFGGELRGPAPDRGRGAVPGGQRLDHDRGGGGLVGAGHLLPANVGRLTVPVPALPFRLIHALIAVF